MLVSPCLAWIRIMEEDESEEAEVSVSTSNTSMSGGRGRCSACGPRTGASEDAGGAPSDCGGPCSGATVAGGAAAIGSAFATSTGPGVAALEGAPVDEAGSGESGDASPFATSGQEKERHIRAAGLGNGESGEWRRLLFLRRRILRWRWPLCLRRKSTYVRRRRASSGLRGGCCLETGRQAACGRRPGLARWLRSQRPRLNL